MIVERFVVVAFLCLSITLPGLAKAAPSVVPAQKIGQTTRDITLQEGGTLHEGGVLVGQLLDAQGVGVAEAPVTVKTAGNQIVSTTTGKDGKFRVAGLQGGVHQVALGGKQESYRLWAPGTAPPSARRGLMQVTNTDVVRGQCDCGTPVCGSACEGGAYGGSRGGGVGRWIANHPLITAGAIGAAIAIPLALDDDDDPPATP